MLTLTLFALLSIVSYRYIKLYRSGKHIARYIRQLEKDNQKQQVAIYRMERTNHALRVLRSL